MGHKNLKRKSKVAVVGAGLAGLSAAYHLRDRARVTIFERDDRLGGRLWHSQQPCGAHGAEYFLKSETCINSLIKELGVRRINVGSKAWPAYYLGRNFHRQWVQGVHPCRAAKFLLGRDSAKRVCDVINLDSDQSESPEAKQRWLVFRKDKRAVQFIRMLLLGETCAPLSHVSPKYALGSLQSIVDETEKWYSFKNGASELLSKLFQESRARIVKLATVTKVEPIKKGARVSWVQAGKERSSVFHAAVIATPDGERLMGKQARHHFHSYLSALLEYRTPPRLKCKKKINLEGGLYTDSPLNYMHVVKHSKSCYVLRILMPIFIWRLARRTPEDLIGLCIKHLRPIMVNPENFVDSSVKFWKFGLPCDDRGKRTETSRSSSIYFAGDRFGEWPSMDAAITSGKLAAQALAETLHISDRKLLSALDRYPI